MRMDLAGGTLSMEGLQVLHMCETDGEKYVWNTVICCAADIKCCCAKVDTLTKSVVPYKHGFLDEDNGGGEYIQWDPWHLLAGMIRAYQLAELLRKGPLRYTLQLMVQCCPKIGITLLLVQSKVTMLHSSVPNGSN